MKTAILPIVLLVSITVCTSEGRSVPVEPRCLCAKVSKSLGMDKVSNIATAEEFLPRSYCNKREVIVTLIDGSSWCLDPNENFTKVILQVLKSSKKKRSVTV